MREHIAQISFWINVIHPRRANQTIHSSGTIAPTIRAQKQVIIAQPLEKVKLALIVKKILLFMQLFLLRA